MGSPSTHPVPLDETLDRLRPIRGGADPVNVLVVPDHPVFNANTLRYYAERRRSRHAFDHIWRGPVTASQLRAYDYVLVKEGGYQGLPFATLATPMVMAALEDESSGFTRLERRLPFPDGSEIVTFIQHGAR